MGGGMKVVSPNFFLETYNYDEICLFHGDIPYKVKIILPQSLHYNHTFSSFALYAI